MSEHEGRLELTWTNKHKRLLATEDGRYQWLSPADYRVAEVRLLHDTGKTGEVCPDDERAHDNLLIHGDALHALNSLVNLPEFEREYVGKVKLAYLDPPFNTQQSFLQYDDALEHSVWLTMMRDRLLQVKTLLSPAGSVWVHCDDSEQAYLKVMMDEIFGRNNFMASVIWEKVYSPRMDAKGFSSSHDYILVYANSEATQLNGYRHEAGSSRMFTQVDEDSRRYRLRSLRKEGKNSLRTDRPNLYYGLEAPNGDTVFPVREDGRDGCWRWQPETYELRKIEVVWIERDEGFQPYLKQYEDESKPRPPETLWPHVRAGHNHEAKEEIKSLLKASEAFATPKPERLLRHVVHIATDPGDIVLDCFLGSATTAAVAHKMGRRWIGIERERETLDNYARPRLTKVVAGEDLGGVTPEVCWSGGGGFRVLEVAPSMFDSEEGQVFLSEWATNGRLAEATAAQLHFVHVDEPPFCGRRGHARLAVVDGLVNADVVRLLVRDLVDGETLTLCGTAIDPDAADALRELRPGSVTRKIPDSIIRGYRREVRWTPPAQQEPAGSESAVAR